MEKYTSAIEISSKKIKLVVGYELNGQVYVIYTLCKPLDSIVNAGTTEDRVEVISSLNNFANIYDESANMSLTIPSVVLSIPPFGLEVYNAVQDTPVLSEFQRITQEDINHCFNQIRNNGVPEGNRLVDIVPLRFTLANGQMFEYPPLEKESPQINLKARAHVLPSQIADNYCNFVRESNIKLKRVIVASHAAVELLETYPDIPPVYYLVDIGSNITTVSAAKHKHLFGSRSFAWGGDNITEKIINTFNVNEEEAERIKILYGYDNRVMNFKAPIATTDDGNGNKVNFYPEDLNKIIKAELDTFVKQLNAAISDLLGPHSNTYKDIPILLIGGGSRLIGLVDYILPKVESEEVRLVVSKTMGARDTSYFNLLGAIYVASKYQISADSESQLKVGPLTRNPN